MGLFFPGTWTLKVEIFAWIINAIFAKLLVIVKYKILQNSQKKIENGGRENKSPQKNIFIDFFSQKFLLSRISTFYLLHLGQKQILWFA